MGSIPDLGKCHRATKPVCHNYWAHRLQLLEPKHPRARAPQQKKPLQREVHAPQLESRPCSLQLEKCPCSNKDPAEPKLKSVNKIMKKQMSEPALACALYKTGRRWDLVHALHVANTSLRPLSGDSGQGCSSLPKSPPGWLLGKPSGLPRSRGRLPRLNHRVLLSEHTTSDQD